MPIYFVFTLALLSITGLKAGQVLLSLYALNLGAQPFAVGILAATYSVLPMLFSWQVGKLVDRFGSRWPLIFGAIGGALGMLVPYYVAGLPALYIAAAMNGFLHAFSSVSLQNLVGLLSNPHNRSQNFSNYSVMASVTGFLGPLLAGFSIDHSGHAIACLYIVLIFLLLVVILAIWGGFLPKGSRSAPHKGGVRDMLAVSGLWRVLITSSMVVTGIDLFQFYMPIYGHGIGLSASAIGVVLAMFAVAAFVVRLIIPFLIAQFSEGKVLTYSFFFGSVCLMLVPFFKSMVVLSLISFALGIGMGCGQPITIMMTFSNSTEGRSGEAMGLRVTVNHLTRVVVPILFGSIGTAFGLFPVFWINALMLASGGAITKPGKIRSKNTCQ
jgi:MFS family permease